MVAEGGPGRLDVGRELRLVERLFGRRVVLLGNYVVDGLFHLLLFFIYTSKMQLIRRLTPPLPSQPHPPSLTPPLLPPNLQPTLLPSN